MSEKDDVQEALSEIKKKVVKLFPQATSVQIVITNNSITATPNFTTEASGFSMQTISGEWVNKAKLLDLEEKLVGPDGEDE